MEVPSGKSTDGWVRRRYLRVLGLVVGLCLVAGVALASLAIGSRSIALSTVVQSFTDFDGSKDHLVVRELRIPRTMLGLLVGSALGVAGALMQAVTRNPLADPGILGVSAGAAFMVVLAIFLFGITAMPVLVWFAFVGAAVASVVVYVLGSLGRGGATPVRLALAGVAFTALLGAFTSAIVLIDQQTLDQYRFWAVGSISGTDMSAVGQVAPFLLVGLVVAFALGRSLNTISLGDDAARALGTRMARTRFITALAIVLLAGAATAICGPIAFIGLTVPLAAQAICGADQRWLILYAAVLGPLVLLSCDIVGRVIARPGEVQVGIMTALIGGPVFVVIVRRIRMGRS